MARLKRLAELSGATTRGTQRLVVAAIKDRNKSNGSSSERNVHQTRALIRAYQSLVADEQITDELVDEENFQIQERAMLYLKRTGHDRAHYEALKNSDNSSRHCTVACFCPPHSTASSSTMVVDDHAKRS
ncbi:hypothetical protein EPA93_45410 [Ktedonosporobacter rubrisoli]|uniref:Uncharacterized protein n=1 Tax=Ktedonosporobacter rubrisoli TaxID=2509675 RepID=A0A4P6K4Q2_KTERU|nr:hypothetical protein [Ktedonosporobacter rubrisoli]QBD82820.1 hypothetical protein EPA93_45410 [Ktedonosporobacter rubrisoli]